MTVQDRAARWLRHGHLWRRVIAIALATSLLVAVASSDRLHGALLDLFAAAHEVIERHPVAGPVVFVLLSAASAMFAFVSSGLLVPPALVAWGSVETFALLWLGWIVGGVASYATARYLGRPVVAALSSGEKLARWEERISQRASFAVVLLFQLAVPSEIPGYVLGLVRYPLPRYLAALMLAELPFAIGTVYFGSGFLERRTTVMVLLGLLGVTVSLGAFRVLHRRLSSSD